MRGSPQADRHPPPQLGLERVSWVRIILDGAGPRCQVAGIAHRRPVLRSVPLRTATALLAAGVPGWVRPSPPAGRPAQTPGPVALADGR